ncbi:MAG: phospholipid carrier-dependent glycosyltransferase [Xanthomonadaceae bacterium]|nr:phospholipid carrier-dependent glycosyltransferase [Xanthomonadaceae bacterium]
MGLSRKTILLITLVSFLGWMLFIFALGTPLKPNFDEFHYVPAAKQFLNSGKNQNWEHPPLTKVLIALGIRIFGDEPLGWRIMSTVAGVVTLAGVGVLGAIWFGSLSVTLWVMLITLFNHLLYVQSRIAMLDTFMFAAMIWSIVFFWSSCQPKHTKSKLRLYLYLAGATLGLAISFKWFAVVLFLPYLASYVMRKSNRLHGAIALIVVPLVIYFGTFLPLLWLKQENYSFWDIFTLQKLIFEGQKRVVSPHPYTSSWWTWIFPIRPIWYAFDKEGEIVRGVLLIGNPMVMWFGLLSLIVSFWHTFKSKNSVARWIVGLFFLFWLSWAIIPRKVHFYYYYYPAGMMLSFSLAYAFLKLNLHKLKWVYLGAVIFFFVYFFPVLSGIPIPSESFRQWMWFNSWI